MRKRKSNVFEVSDEALLNYISHGMTTKQISIATGYSERTIRHHTQRLGAGNKDANHSRAVAEASFIKRLNASELGKTFEYAGGYETNRKRVALKCKTCGYEYTPIVRELDRGKCRKQCPRCAEQAKEADKHEHHVIYVKTCNECEAVYFTQYDTQEYCSKSCKTRAKGRRYRTTHPKRVKSRSKHLGRMKYYAKKYGWPLPQYDSTVTLKAVVEKYGSVCQICGETCNENIPTKRPTVDHITELCLGGSHTWDNVRLACNECNFSRNKNLYERMQKSIGA